MPSDVYLIRCLSVKIYQTCFATGEFVAGLQIVNEVSDKICFLFFATFMLISSNTNNSAPDYEIYNA